MQQTNQELVDKWKASGLLDGLKERSSKKADELFRCCDKTKLDELSEKLPDEDDFNSLIEDLKNGL